MSLILKTWQRYFVYEFLKTLIFVLLLIFVLYSLIDFSSRRASFHSHGISFSLFDFFWYYLCSFSKELNVLLPFSAMISVIKCVSDLNQNRELIALFASGLSLKTLMRPFFVIGVVLSLFSLSNQEFFYPLAMRSIHKMESDKNLKHKKKKETLQGVKSTHLQDGSTLLYMQFDQDSNSLLDVVWIRHIDDIYKMKMLSLNTDSPLGTEVDHFVRRGDELTLDSYEKERTFKLLPPAEELLFDKLVEQDELSLTAMNKMIPSFFACESEKDCNAVASLLMRLLLPWINLIAVIGPLPLLVNHSRSQALFLIFGISIFSFVFVFLLIEAASILAKRQTLSPLSAILVPFLTIFFTILLRYLLLK